MYFCALYAGANTECTSARLYVPYEHRIRTVPNSSAKVCIGTHLKVVSKRSSLHARVTC